MVFTTGSRASATARLTCAFRSRSCAAAASRLACDCWAGDRLGVRNLFTCWWRSLRAGRLFDVRCIVWFLLRYWNIWCVARRQYLIAAVIASPAIRVSAGKTSLQLGWAKSVNPANSIGILHLLQFLDSPSGPISSSVAKIPETSASSSSKPS